MRTSGATADPWATRLEGEQSHELGAGRPQRQPDGELARLFRDAGQVQVRHVRAADREHDERQRQHGDDDREDPDRGVVRRGSRRADARRGVGAGGGLRRGDPCRRDRQLPLDIRNREAGFHASDDGEPAGIERRARRPLWRKGEGHPRLHAIRVILAGVERLHPVETRWRQRKRPHGRRPGSRSRRACARACAATAVRRISDPWRLSRAAAWRPRIRVGRRVSRRTLVALSSNTLVGRKG